MKIIDLVEKFNEYFDYINYDLLCSDDEKVIVKALIDKDERYEYSDYLVYYLDSGEMGRINEKTTSNCSDFYISPIMIENNLYIISSLDEEDIKTRVIKMQIDGPEMKTIYESSRDENIYILNEEYFVLMEDLAEQVSDYDEEKDREGLYIKARLLDLKENRSYQLKDKKFRLGLNNLEIINIKGQEYILLEENYYELWDLEDYYLQGFKRSDFIREGYKESINLISIDEFVKNIKNEEEVNYKVIFETDYNENTRYFGRDRDYIYLTNKNFDTGMENINRIDLNNLDLETIGQIDYKNYEEYTDVTYDLENRRIYYFTDESLVELYPKNKRFQVMELEGYGDNILGIIEDNLIFYGFYEDEDGRNYFDYVRFMGREESRIYKKALGKIIGDSLIIYSN